MIGRAADDADDFRPFAGTAIELPLEQRPFLLGPMGEEQGLQIAPPTWTIDLEDPYGPR